MEEIYEREKARCVLLYLEERYKLVDKKITNFTPSRRRNRIPWAELKLMAEGERRGDSRLA